MVWVWLALTVALLVAELCTTQLVSIWCSRRLCNHGYRGFIPKDTCSCSDTYFHCSICSASFQHKEIRKEILVKNKGAEHKPGALLR